MDANPKQSTDDNLTPYSPLETSHSLFPSLWGELGHDKAPRGWTLPWVLSVMLIILLRQLLWYFSWRDPVNRVHKWKIWDWKTIVSVRVTSYDAVSLLNGTIHTQVWCIHTDTKRLFSTILLRPRMPEGNEKVYRKM